MKILAHGYAILKNQSVDSRVSFSLRFDYPKKKL